MPLNACFQRHGERESRPGGIHLRQELGQRLRRHIVRVVGPVIEPQLRVGAVVQGGGKRVRDGVPQNSGAPRPRTIRHLNLGTGYRSEERRVGKGGRYGWSKDTSYSN